jgi:outer membrane protein with beta-barrel domain
MMRRALLLSAIVLCVSACFAQTSLFADKTYKWEFTPFVGFETGSSTPVQFQVDQNGNPVTSIDRTGIAKGLSYGGFVDYNRFENLSFEFMFTRNPTTYRQHDVIANQEFIAYDADVDQYQFGGIFHLFDETHKMRPYFGASVGFAHDSNSGGHGGTSFAYSVGGGVQYYPTRHIGFRTDLRYMPAYSTTIQGTVCDPFFGCFNQSQREFFNRVNMVGGVAFRF